MHRQMGAGSFLRQGDLVTFQLPYAQIGKEITGRQIGVILSSAENTSASERLCICPVLRGKNPTNESLGLLMPFASEAGLYMRPDLSTCIAVDYGKVRRVRADAAPLSRKIIAEPIDRLLNILKPSPEKLSESGQRFLAYGQIGWFEDVPFVQATGSSAAPVVCLTPPSIYSQTGIAIVARGFSHMNKFHPRCDIAVAAHKWFMGAYFSATHFQALSIDRLAKRSGNNAFSIGEQALRGMFRKTAAIFCNEVYVAVAERYSNERGLLPAPVITGSLPKRAQHNRL